MSNINKIYVYNFFRSLVFAYVIERLFWASKGINILQVVWLEIIYSAIVVTLELPMGMYADRFSRKNLVVFDAVAGILEILIITLAQNFWHFVLAISLAAIGQTMQSGAHNALVYDTLEIEGESSTFEKVLGRIQGLGNLGAMLSGLIGGVIASSRGLISAYWLSLISLIIALLVALTLKEIRVTPIEKESWKKEEWKEIFNFVIRHKRVRKVMFVAVIVGASVNFLYEFWQIFAEEVSITLVYFGVIQLVSFAVVSLGGFMADSIKSKIGFRYVIMLSLLLTGIGFTIMSFRFKLLGLAMMAMIYFASSVLEPVSLGYLHHHAIEKYRATIESAFSVIEHLAIALIGIPFGLISTKLSIFAGFLFLSIILITIGLWSTLWLKEY
ncbi:MAG: MFS transporter [Clostridiaceae bacterium]